MIFVAKSLEVSNKFEMYRRRRTILGARSIEADSAQISGCSATVRLRLGLSHLHQFKLVEFFVAETKHEITAFRFRRSLVFAYSVWHLWHLVED